MWKIICAATLFAATPLGMLTASAPAHADSFGYPCQYPGVGTGAFVFGAEGQFCDFPTEVNGTHWHCESGGVRLGGLGLAGQNGISLGALGVIGGGGEGCSWRCPDNTLGPAPNPPGGWKEYMVPRLNYCRGHEIAAGGTSALVAPDEGLLPPPPGALPPPPPEDVAPQLPAPGRREQLPAPRPEGEVALPPLPIPPLPLPPPIPGG